VPGAGAASTILTSLCEGCGLAGGNCAGDASCGKAGGAADDAGAAPRQPIKAVEHARIKNKNNRVLNIVTILG
jgi:hypothetical protein